MKHEMKLNDSPFNKIKNGTKRVELRLYDEKRQLLNVGDKIEFTNLNTSEKLTVQIEDLKKFQSFEELYEYFDKKCSVMKKILLRIQKIWKHITRKKKRENMASLP